MALHQDHFDYFLASSALCAAYLQQKSIAQSRDIPTDNIRLSANNIVDPENRYKQIFKIQGNYLNISEKDRQGILRSIDRCTVKSGTTDWYLSLWLSKSKVLMPMHKLYWYQPDFSSSRMSQSLPLEEAIANMSGILAGLGM